jgi:raffinose/stachyose/melibiose transport system substrate-binding protein
MGLSYEEVGNSFKQGNVAMCYDGSWMAAPWEEEGSPIKGKFVCKTFPSITTEPKGIGGGSSGAFVVSANTKNPEAAVTAAKVIAENFSKYSYQDGFGLPSWKVEVDESKLLDVTVQMSNIAKDASGFMLNFDTLMEPAAATEYLNFLQDLCAKTITPEEFAKRVQDVVDAN